MNKAEKSTCPSKAPIGGMMMSSTKDETIFPKDAPIMTPTAKSMTFPRIANSLNSFSMVFLLVRRLNRRGVVNAKVIRKWCSDPHRPRVMRSHSQGRRARRSHRGAIRGRHRGGFPSKADADQFRAELTERMRKFNLELHPEKTRLLEFGPYAIDQ